MVRCALIAVIATFLVVSYSKSQTLADSGYYYLNQGNKSLATKYFEDYVRENPTDTKIRMQLAYIYYEQKNYRKSLEYFRYVGSHSQDQKQVELSKSAAYVIKEEMSAYAARSMDLYFYNFYDTHQENYIANFVGHYNFRIAPSFYTGFYVNVYTDTRSTPEVIYNDRYLEFGGFLRYNFLKNLFLEFRLGYAREIDLNKNSINVEPLLVYFTRFGNARIFVNSSSSSKTDLYMDMYYAALYDNKFKNSFVQSAWQEVLRFHTGGYSYLEPYLVQNLSIDSRRLNYNNYGEVGGGLRFHADVPFFPVLFIEPVYRAYFYSGIKSNFTVKGGFVFNFRTPL